MDGGKYVVGQWVIVRNGDGDDFVVTQLLEMMAENKNLATRPQRWRTRYGDFWSFDLDLYPRVVKGIAESMMNLLKELEDKQNQEVADAVQVKNAE